MARNLSPASLPGFSLSTAPLDRLLGADSDFDIRRGSHAWDDQSALGVWLIAQGIRSSDCSLMRVQDVEPDWADPGEKLCSAANDFNGIDRIADVPDSPHRTSLTGLSRCGEHRESCSLSQCAGQLEDAARSVLDASTSGVAQDDVKSSGHAPADHGSGSAEKQPVDNVSSYYPSALPSFQSSPDMSTTNHFSLSPQDIESLSCHLFIVSRLFSCMLGRGLLICQGMVNSPLCMTLGSQKSKAHTRRPRRKTLLAFSVRMQLPWVIDICLKEGLRATLRLSPRQGASNS